MKLKLVLVSLVAGFMLTSCYDADSLPDQFESTYEFAIPVIDTTIKVTEFPYFDLIGQIPGGITIPAGTTINSGQMEFPFYLGDFTDEGNMLEWIEPKIILDANLPAGATIQIDLYTYDEYSMPYYFWLPEKYTVGSSSGSVTIPPTPVKINDDVLRRIENAGEVYMELYLTFSNPVTYNELQLSSLYNKFGIKARVKMLIDL